MISGQRGAPATGGNHGRRLAGGAGPLRGWYHAWDPLRVSLYGQIVVAISAIQMYLGPLRSLRPALLLILVAFGAILLRPRAAHWANLRLSRPAKAVGWLLVIAIGSTVFGLSTGASASYLLDNYLRILTFFFLLVVGIRHVKDLAFFVWAYVISTGILVGLALTVLDLQPTMGGLGRLEGTGMFDANDLGMVMLMALPLAFLFHFNAGFLGRAVARFVIVGIPITLALTGSRGAMVGLMVVGPALFLTLSRVGIMRRFGAVGVLLVGLMIGAPEGYWQQMSTIFSAEEDYNVTSEYGRMPIAKRGVSYMLRYPVFGVGIANFPRAEGTISPIAAERLAAGQAVQWIAPHNTYVQVGAELGLLAMMIWLSLLYMGTVGLWRLRQRIPTSWESDSPERKFLRELCLFLPVSFLAFAVTSFFLSHAYTPPVYIFFGYLGAVQILVRRELAKDRFGVLGTPTRSSRRAQTLSAVR